jgi:hypothetical protein
MTRINFDAVRSFAIAGLVSVYASLMLAAALSANGSMIA